MLIRALLKPATATQSSTCPGGRRRVMTTDVVERARRMLENGATRQQVADVTGVDVKTIYKYLPAT
ncbi:hypothetical protein B6I39_26620 [Klebsiella quasipneumoniae]|nr:hypothetical protein B6I39_26620 [Klebsiella quasipneumoniae]